MPVLCRYAVEDFVFILGIRFWIPCLSDPVKLHHGMLELSEFPFNSSPLHNSAIRSMAFPAQPCRKSASPSSTKHFITSMESRSPRGSPKSKRSLFSPPLDFSAAGSSSSVPSSSSLRFGPGYRYRVLPASIPHHRISLCSGGDPVAICTDGLS